MPFLGGLFASIGSFLAANAPAIGAASSIAGAATTIGSTIYNDVSQPSATPPSQPAVPPTLTAAQNVANEVAKRGQEALVARNQQPGLIANTSGGLSDQAYQTESSALSGNPGEFGAGGFDLNKVLQMLGAGGSSGNTDLTQLASGSIAA